MTPKDSFSESNYRRISLFSLRFALVILFLFVCLMGIFWRMGSITEKNAAEYFQLMADAESSHSSSQGTPYTARQERKGVQKDLFFQKGNNRLQIHLSATEAQLVLDHQDAHTYVVEQMQKVKCYMQEELYYVLPDGKEAVPQSNGQLLLRSADEKDPNSWISKETPELRPMSSIRYIEADEAEYHYKDDRFVAQSVKITRYSVPGHQLQEISEKSKVWMKSTADAVEFSLKSKDKDLNFKAHHLKAAFYDTGMMKI